MRPVGYGLTFLISLSLVLGGVAAYGAFADTGVDTPPKIENEQYTDETLVNDRAPGESNVQMSVNARSQTIVIDPGVDPQSTPTNPLLLLFGGGGPETADRDIRPLVNTLIDNGHEVRVHLTPEDQRQRTTRPGPSGEPTELGTELADADAFVTFGTDYTDAELKNIETFTDRNGRVVYATDPGDEFDQPGAADLESRLGVTRDPGYVYNLVENDNNYQRLFAQPADDSQLTTGVERVVFPTVSPVGAADGGPAFVPTENARLSTSRAETNAGVVAQNGNVVIVGDTDFFTPENAQRADNDVFIGNIADFLVSTEQNQQSPPPERSTGESEQSDPQQSPAS